MLVFALGCESAGTRGPTLSQEVEQLSAEKTGLQNKVEQQQRENEQLKKAVEGLSKLPGDKKAEEIYQLKGVKIGKYTNLYDEDKNGTRETLAVYIQPMDETGDSIKAAGAVEVQLWDLNKKESEALLGQWRVEPNEMKKKWLNSIFGGNYRLGFDAAGKVEKFDKPLTVRVVFTDYLSGRIFTEEKVIKP